VYCLTVSRESICGTNKTGGSGNFLPPDSAPERALVD
jgi:hypothetical protein